MPRIDFNCDLGEGCGDDAAIVPWITSASIACGAHAGDDDTMRATLRLCRAHGVAAGAHPGYADRGHFGRRELALAARELHALLEAPLQRIGASNGRTVCAWPPTWVSPTMLSNWRSPR